MSFTSFLTGGIIDPNNSQYGKIAVSNEAKRKGLINLGEKQINAVFDGGSAPFYTLATDKGFSRKTWLDAAGHVPYYAQNRSGEFAPYYMPKDNREKYPVDPITGQQTAKQFAQNDYALTRSVLSAGMDLPANISAIAGMFGSKPPTPRDMVNKALRRHLLFNAPETKTFTGFGEDFYNQRAKDYTDFALPEVGRQYRTTRDAINYNLYNRGLGNSSVADQQHNELERTSGEAKQQVADTAINQANQLRTDVQNAKEKSLQQLYQTGDPSHGYASAIQAASSVQRPSTFAPLADMFSNLSKTYYTNALINGYRNMGAMLPQNQNYDLSSALGPTTY